MNSSWESAMGMWMDLRYKATSTCTLVYAQPNWCLHADNLFEPRNFHIVWQNDCTGQLILSELFLIVFLMFDFINVCKFQFFFLIQ